MHSLTSCSPRKASQSLHGTTHSAADMLFSGSCHTLPATLRDSQRGTPDWNPWWWPDLSAAQTRERASFKVAWSSLKSAPWGLQSTERMVLQLLLPFIGVFLLDCLLPEGCKYFWAQSVPFYDLSLYLASLSNTSTGSSSLLFPSVMTGLYLNIYHETGMSIKVVSLVLVSLL